MDTNGPSLAPERRWLFASACFDESAWTLHVDGQRVTVENKPLQLLRCLLDRPGKTVSKGELLDAVWPGVIVVEASLPTAMNKLRRALGDRDGRIIETVPGIGYRLAVPATREGETAPPQAAIAVPLTPTTSAPPRPRWPVATALGLASLAAVLILAFNNHPPSPPISQAEAQRELHKLDLEAVQELLDQGWSPMTQFDEQRNDALNVVLAICESNPGHDRRQLQRVVWLLLNNGARPDVRNVWGDTAYSIARSERYCGPDHPATRQLRLACRDNNGLLRPACLPDYAHSEWPQDPRRTPLPQVVE